VRHLRDLELAVLLRQLRRHVVQHVQDAALVQPFGVFPRVVAPAVHERALQFERTFERLPFEIAGNHLGHSPEDAEVPEALAQDVALERFERPPLREVRVDFLDEPRVVSERPQELLEVERVHFDVGLVAHRMACDPLVVDAQQRPAGDHVEPAVLREELEARRDFGERLDFVEEEKRPAGDEPQGRIHERNAPDDLLRGEPSVGDPAELRAFHEVDFDDRAVAPGREMPDRFRLPDLPGPLQQQRLSLLAPRPSVENAVDLPRDVFHRIVPFDAAF